MSSYRAIDWDSIEAFIGFCKTGKLLEVQNWISSGNPVNPPEQPRGKTQRYTPLQIAINKGFHSLVQVLLEAGALLKDGTYDALKHAIKVKRLDLVELLVEHGADPTSVDMRLVFDKYSPDLIDYFILHGADADSEHPLAFSLIERRRPAIGAFKRHRKRVPSFQEQCDIALRYFSMEGDQKWVALLLWAGANPHSVGPVFPPFEPDPNEDLCAVEIAVQDGHYDLLKEHEIEFDLDSQLGLKVLEHACAYGRLAVVEECISKGFDPKLLDDRASSYLECCINGMQYSWAVDPIWVQKRKPIDSMRSAEAIEIIDLLCQNGARWEPANRKAITEARRAFLRLTPKHTVDFVKIMSKYQSCSRKVLDELLGTPAIQRHIKEYAKQIGRLLQRLG